MRCVAILVLAMALVGCGGDGGGEVTHHALRACLEDEGARVSTASDDLYGVASDDVWEGDGMVVTIGENKAAVNVQRSEADAERLRASAEQIGEAFLEGAPLDDVLKQQGNVVVEWSESPTDEENATVEGCL
jgi:hypothetical protein